jgi:hypothetical protein
MGGLMEITVFIGLTMLAMVLFAGWLMVSVARIAWRGIEFLRGSESTSGLSGRTCRCSRLRCGAYNPIEANFCRRCGSAMRRAAVAGGRMAA